jgi:hypothetical protein
MVVTPRGVYRIRYNQAVQKSTVFLCHPVSPWDGFPEFGKSSTFCFDQLHAAEGFADFGKTLGRARTGSRGWVALVLLSTIVRVRTVFSSLSPAMSRIDHCWKKL